MSSSKYLILLVDDDKALLRLLSMPMMAAGYEVTAVTSGGWAVAWGVASAGPAGVPPPAGVGVAAVSATATGVPVAGAHVRPVPHVRRRRGSLCPAGGFAERGRVRKARPGPIGRVGQARCSRFFRSTVTDPRRPADSAPW